ncbi:MerR family transcriptional regulator [Geomicrobium sediminis]|uniref:Chromosome-anchoring protein RacA n=1 Tax=Geomicrobium sediminis TaxID=1347788 RepID=A0ABS2PDI5_9BACL|nr:MerR family transcriptional regulator [Geomicrobium sediminis]MBM7633489.1 chromosome-anchoring protein RacA [Geomicrobium sediminis]
MKLAKTQYVADQLNVAPKTIQNWVRKHEVPVITNDRGHYLYDVLAIEKLRQVKERQLPDREPVLQELATIKPSEDEKALLKASTQEAEKRMEDIIKRLDHLERMIEQKADEVVSFQLLKHRTELDDVQQSVKSIEDQLTVIEHQQIEKAEKEKTVQPKSLTPRKRQNIFSFS